jgi:hypothetical protein
MKISLNARLPDDIADAAINEILIRAGQRSPKSGDEYRWAAEGSRAVKDLDAVKGWVEGG